MVALPLPFYINHPTNKTEVEIKLSIGLKLRGNGTRGKLNSAKEEQTSDRGSEKRSSRYHAKGQKPARRRIGS